MRPSEPFLVLLRDLVKKRGLNNAALSERAGLPRQRVRKILSGAEPMTVDELLQLSGVLELSPADMGLTGDLGEIETAEASEEPTDREGSGDPNVDPYGNQPEQLFRIAFDLGCDFLFLCDTDQLEDCGVPDIVLSQFQDREIPIKLDAAYHAYNEPRYTDEGVTLTLSFDALYECTFPWSAIQQVIFYPEAPEPLEDSEEADLPGPPTLRLVE